MKNLISGKEAREALGREPRHCEVIVDETGKPIYLSRAKARCGECGGLAEVLMECTSHPAEWVYLACDVCEHDVCRECSDPSDGDGGATCLTCL